MQAKNYKVKNQFIINDGRAVYFQSYNSLICKYDYDSETLTIYKDWDYSSTTRKYLYLFLKEYCGIYLDSKNKRKAIRELIKQDKIFKSY